MKISHKKVDIFLVILISSIVIGLPIGIYSYEHQSVREDLPEDARIFTLTGHTEKGWLLGEIQAHDVLSLGLTETPFKKPTLTVSKGDRVVLRLKSSDVVHGFSLKDFGVFINDGIQPGKTVLVSFTADKTGTFTFSCNAICGDNHKNMQGTLVVEV